MAARPGAATSSAWCGRCGCSTGRTCTSRCCSSRSRSTRCSSAEGARPQDPLPSDWSIASSTCVERAIAARGLGWRGAPAHGDHGHDRRPGERRRVRPGPPCRCRRRPCRRRSVNTGRRAVDGLCRSSGTGWRSTSSAVPSSSSCSQVTTPCTSGVTPDAVRSEQAAVGSPVVSVVEEVSQSGLGRCRHRGAQVGRGVRLHRTQLAGGSLPHAESRSAAAASDVASARPRHASASVCAPPGPGVIPPQRTPRPGPWCAVPSRRLEE